MLKVIAADGDTGLGALAHVVDGLPYLGRTHPIGKTVDGGPQLSHRGGRMAPELDLTGILVPEIKGREVRRSGRAAKLAVLEDNLLHLSLRKGALWTSHYLK